MEPMKLDIFFAFFAYGGNGGIAMQLPEISTWFAKLCMHMHEDPRIGRFGHQRFGDVPLTMERNRAVVTAKTGNFDVLVMVDSDNAPDMYLDKDVGAKPFFESSFDFLYERKLKGLPSAICAPYCGPPPHPARGGMENVYVFYAEDRETDNLESGFSFEAYSRQQAAQMTGIQPIAAGPTGCIMYSTDAFDLMPVRNMRQEDILDLYIGGKITQERALRLINMQSWFFYEYTNLEQTNKASTEDVTNTREIQLAGLAKHNKSVVFCNWDAWAGHYKPKCVGKPTPVRVNEINSLYKEAVESHVEPTVELKMLDFTGGNGEGKLSDIVPEVEPEETITAASEDSEEDTSLRMDRYSGTDDDFAPAENWNNSVIPRMINGRRVETIGNYTPDEDLNSLTEIVRHMVARRKGAPLRIVEVGSWVGETALALHAGLNEDGGVVYCVDTWKGCPTDGTGAFCETVGSDKIFQQFLTNVGDLINDQIRPIKGYSVEVASEFPYPQDADIVFIDAAHDYKNVRADIDAWLPHVAPDGILCGHDFCDGFPGVVRAVKETCDEGNMMPTFINGTSIWFLKKEDWLKGMKQSVASGSEADTASAD